MKTISFFITVSILFFSIDVFSQNNTWSHSGISTLTSTGDVGIKFPLNTPQLDADLHLVRNDNCVISIYKPFQRFELVDGFEHYSEVEIPKVCDADRLLWDINVERITLNQSRLYFRNIKHHNGTSDHYSDITPLQIFDEDYVSTSRLSINSLTIHTDSKLDLTNGSFTLGKPGKKFMMDPRHYLDGDMLIFFTESSGSWEKIIEFHNDGKVCIGNGLLSSSSHFSTYKLSVNGKIVCKEVAVTVSDWSDFVFEDNYDLMSLSDLESYIYLNNHLPDVPSEKEVIEQGINLGEMDAILLQKIEELILYVIELKKENEDMKKELLQLQIK